MSIGGEGAAVHRASAARLRQRPYVAASEDRDETVNVMCFVRRAYPAIALLGVSAVAARAQRPVPRAVVRDGTLTFDGRATVGDFTGVTQAVSGEVRAADDLRGARGWVEAPVRSLHTGNGHRDRDLNKSMESDRYPTLRFELQGATTDTATAPMSDTVAATLHGLLSAHGVARAVDVPATLVFAGDAIRVTGEFPLDLRDYKIGGLSRMLGMLKMHEQILVHLDLWFAPADAIVEHTVDSARLAGGRPSP